MSGEGQRISFAEDQKVASQFSTAIILLRGPIGQSILWAGFTNLVDLQMVGAQIQPSGNLLEEFLISFKLVCLF